MRPAQFTLRDLLMLFGRRKLYFLLPIILITLLCIGGAYMLPNRYESSTTILVQRDEILNPLVSYEMAASMASEDRLRTFNEIIYSRTTLKRLIDSLDLAATAKTEAERQALVDVVEKNIVTERRGPDSFRITYTDSDPKRAQRAASLLSDLFIETNIRIEGQRNDQAVQFYIKKLDEIKNKYEASQRLVVSSLQEHLSNDPSEAGGLSIQFNNLEKQLSDLDAQIKNYEDELATLKRIPDSLHNENGKQALYNLQRTDLPFADDLKTLLSKYDDYLRRYTAKYPEVEKLERQIVALLERMRNAVEPGLRRLESQRLDLERRRAQLVDKIKQNSISQRVDQDKESDYSVYRKLYDEMKVKLEQAETARDLGRKSANQFIVIDPALVPSRPSKPNRSQIVLGGFGLGIFLGFVVVILKEMLDTTIRVPKDVEVYHKPIIALIADGEDHNR